MFSYSFIKCTVLRIVVTIVFLLHSSSQRQQVKLLHVLSHRNFEKTLFQIRKFIYEFRFDATQQKLILKLQNFLFFVSASPPAPSSVVVHVLTINLYFCFLQLRGNEMYPLRVQNLFQFESVSKIMQLTSNSNLSICFDFNCNFMLTN